MTTERVIEILKEQKLFTECPLSAKLLSDNAECNERQLRKLVEEIRANDLATGYVLISSNEGYKLSNDADEIGLFLNRYLSAAFTQIKVAQVAKKFLSDQQSKDIQLNLNF